MCKQCGLLGAVAALAMAGLAGAASFDDDVAFLKQHVDTIVLTDGAQAQVAVCAAYQGRVMTSTARGGAGASFGWVNRELISSGELRKHINVFGGEDRFWMGPEGGQYAIFFAKGAPKFDMENWQTPPVIDTEPFELAESGADFARFTRQAKFANYSGTEFDVRIDRNIRLMDRKVAGEVLGVAVPESVDTVAFATENTLTNTGAKAWTKDKGLLSIWILGMFNAAPQTTVVIPFKEGPESELGPKVNDTYFGKVPGERLVVRDNVLFFKGDANYRSKIGLSPRRAKPVMGSYDAESGTLTLAHYTLPEGATEYVNSMWEMQKEPYAGDVANSYNDGPSAPGKPGMGAFYELESSSPAAALAAGASISHLHRTFHFQGAEKDLDAIAKQTLGVGLAEIRTAFGDSEREGRK